MSGQVATSGASMGGAAATGGTAPATGGSSGMGTGTAGASSGGSGVAGAGAGGSGTGGSSAGGGGSGTCTASKATGKTVSGSGPHEVVIETNSENGIKCGTIHPKDSNSPSSDLVWGMRVLANGLSNQAPWGKSPRGY